MNIAHIIYIRLFMLLNTRIIIIDIIHYQSSTSDPDVFVPLDDSRVLDGESTAIVTAIGETNGNIYGCAVQVKSYYQHGVYARGRLVIHIYGNAL